MNTFALPSAPMDIYNIHLTTIIYAPRMIWGGWGGGEFQLEYQYFEDVFVCVCGNLQT